VRRHTYTYTHIHTLCVRERQQRPSRLCRRGAGVQLYFEKSLGTRLLYRFERPQYEAMFSTFPLLVSS
jgi:hypothetical protein